MKKRVIALLTFVAMAFTMLSPAACKSVEAADKVTSNDGYFYHASEVYLTKDFKAKYYYLDDYFAKSAFKYQDSLATMSMCLSMSAFRSNRTTKYSKKSQNMEALLKDCGFTDFKASTGFKNKPTEDSTGTGIAHKKITVDGKTYTLIALAISGGCIEAEWGGSIRIGRSGNGYNGQAGAESALEFLKKYVKDEDISGNVKLWITGYGVGGGKANLLAGMIDKNPSLGSGVKVKPENMYAYCFQAPQLATTDQALQSEKFENIFNINNPYNVMTLLASGKYNMGRYGVDKFTATAGTDRDYVSKRDAMLKKMASMDKSLDYTVDDFKMKALELTFLLPPFGDPVRVVDASKNQSMDVFLKDLINRVIYNCAPTRSDYVSEFESELADLLCVMQGNTDQNWDDCVEMFVGEIQNNITEIGINMYLGLEDNLVDLYEDYAWKSIERAGVTKITDADVTKLSKVLAKLAIEFGTDYPAETITFIYNLGPIFAASEPVMNLAWLQSIDDNYNGKKFVNSFEVEDITKTVYSKDRTITLDIEPKDDAKVSYKSDNKSITVSSKGKITIKKNYIGKATISVTSAVTSKYQKTTKKFTVTVKPVKATITSVSHDKKKKLLVIKNKKDIGSVKYQVEIATNSSFKDSKKYKASYSSKGLAMQNPKKGKTYYIRVRGYKIVNNKTYYGTWSSVKKIKIK